MSSFLDVRVCSEWRVTETVLKVLCQQHVIFVFSKQAWEAHSVMYKARVQKGSSCLPLFSQLCCEKAQKRDEETGNEEDGGAQRSEERKEDSQAEGVCSLLTAL